MSSTPRAPILNRDGRVPCGTSIAKPVTILHLTCWRKLACRGASLPLLRQTGGVCEACVKAEKNRDSVMAVTFVHNDAAKGKPRKFTSKKDYSIRGGANNSSQKGFKIPDGQLAATSGHFTRIGGTVMSQRDRSGALKLVPCIRVRRAHGEQLILRSSWTRIEGRARGCRLCLREEWNATRRERESFAREHGLRVYGQRVVPRRGKAAEA